MTQNALVRSAGTRALILADDRTNLIESFLAGRSARTREAYGRDLADFAAFLGVPDVRAAGELLVSQPHGAANGVALSYRAHLIERGLAPATVNRRLASVRSLVQLARTLGHINWTLDVQGVESMAYRDTQGPGREGYRRLLAVLDARQGPKAARDRAILRLLYDRGLRRGEVASLDLEHVDLDASMVSVLGKGRTARESLTLAPQTVDALRAWIELRGAEPGPLFLNFDRAGKGRRLTDKSIWRVVKAIGEVAGIRARPHGLRHTAITDALDRTAGDVRRVQRFSRHRDVRVLWRYDDNRADLGGEVARLIAADT